MCGIAGVWRIGDSPSDLLEASAEAMAHALHHRGPDDLGVWSDPQAGLAFSHQRLAVQDLSAAGSQPMHSATGRYVMVFNGEIYNHQHLRTQLGDSHLLRRSWRGHSDTETLLAAIEAWGLASSLERCAGMFALALWDRSTHCLYLARDRFGEKPLYWGWLQQAGRRVFAFASELSAVRALPHVSKPNLNPKALQSFFQHGSIPSPLCIYEGLHQLQPGHYVQFSAPDRPARSRPWWDLQNIAQDALSKQSFLRSPSFALDSLHNTLLEVIQEQALSDVPLGSFLSGGIDSSLITALLQAQTTQPVRSFTIAFPDMPGFNEAPSAAAVAAHLGTDHTEVPLTSQDAYELIPQLPNLYSEPFADSSQLPTHLVCREARRCGLTVALTGDGGDELFGGYNRHWLLPKLHRRFGSFPPLLRDVLACGLEHMPVSPRGLARNKRQKLSAALRSADSLQNLHHSVTSVWPDPGCELMQPHWAIVANTSAEALPLALTPSEQLMLADTLAYLPNDILVKVDRAAMAASLETRAPFLDHRVSLLAWQLPLSLKITSEATTKLILRQLLDRYVPRHLVDRPKAGFAMPIGEWLRGPLRSWADDLLNPIMVQRQGYLRPEPIQKMWRQHLDGRDQTPRLWSVLMWQAWLAAWDQ